MRAITGLHSKYIITWLLCSLLHRNGDTYAGEYFADKMHGFGVYQFGNGHRYDGAWHEGRRQGLGMYTFRNGETQSGHWQNGILDVSTAENGNPGSLKATSHSKVLSAVQVTTCFSFWSRMFYYNFLDESKTKLTKHIQFKQCIVCNLS